MNCLKCGAVIAPNEKFCGTCGAAAPVSQQPTTSAVAPAPVPIAQQPQSPVTVVSNAPQQPHTPPVTATPPTQQAAQNRFCVRCGNPILAGQNVCTRCGTPANSYPMQQQGGYYAPQQPYYSGRPMYPGQSPYSQTSPAFIIGVILLIAGIIGALIAGITMVGDVNDYNSGWGYNYSGHITSHEGTMIAVLIISLIGGFIGLIMTLSNRRK